MFSFSSIRCHLIVSFRAVRVSRTWGLYSWINVLEHTELALLLWTSDTTISSLPKKNNKALEIWGTFPSSKTVNLPPLPSILLESIVYPNKQPSFFLSSWAGVTYTLHTQHHNLFISQAEMAKAQAGEQDRGTCPHLWPLPCLWLATFTHTMELWWCFRCATGETLWFHHRDL